MALAFVTFRTVPWESTLTYIVVCCFRYAYFMVWPQCSIKMLAGGGKADEQHREVMPTSSKEKWAVAITKSDFIDQGKLQGAFKPGMGDTALNLKRNQWASSFLSSLWSLKILGWGEGKISFWKDESTWVPLKSLSVILHWWTNCGMARLNNTSLWAGKARYGVEMFLLHSGQKCKVWI